MPADIRQFLRLAPVPLAVVDGDGTVDLNDPAGRLLAGVVSSSEAGAARWLFAAVERLHAQGFTRETLTARRGDETLDLTVEISRLGDTPWPVMAAVTPAAAVRDGQDDLATTVSTLSHELRTPLTSMKSSLKLVAGGETGPLNEDQRHFLEMTLRNIDRLDRLVGDLLDTSRADAGRLVIRHEKLDLMPALQECLALQSEAARTAGLTLDTVSLPATFMAEVDTDKVVRMVSNVVSNAVKYTPTGGLVRVWLEQTPDPTGDMFAVVVEDNGPGMDAAAQTRIFDPYRRGHDEAVCAIPGSGLGLHITRGLAEAHGGQLSLFSEPGRGTSVWIRLPRFRSAGLTGHHGTRPTTEVTI